MRRAKADPVVGAPAIITPLSWALWQLAEALERGDSEMPDIWRPIAAELGRLLRQVADGGDPRALRVKRESPSPTAVAYFYHYERIRAPRFSDARAVRELQREQFRGLAASTIRKYGQMHRDHVLNALERGTSPFDLATGDERSRKIAKLWGEFATDASKKHALRIRRYREYLRKKSPREYVERPR